MHGSSCSSVLLELSASRWHSSAGAYNPFQLDLDKVQCIANALALEVLPIHRSLADLFAEQGMGKSCLLSENALQDSGTVAFGI